MSQASLPFSDFGSDSSELPTTSDADQELAEQLAALTNSVVVDLAEEDEQLHPLIEENEELQPSQGPIRSDLADKVLNVLRADAERGDGILRREDLERQCFRRNLNVPECIFVEQALMNSGVTIDDDSGDIPRIEDEPKNRARNYPRRFLNETEERELGRKVRLFLRAKESAEAVPEETFNRMAKDAADARTAFVETNIRWLRQTAAFYAKTKHLTEEDLFQEGVLGVIRATELWDPELGYRFKTYAGWWVSQKMHRAIADGDRTVRLPVHVVEKIRRIQKVSRILALRNGEEPGISLLASTLGMTDERLAELMWTVKATDCLDGDAPITNSLDGDGETSLMSLLHDDRAVSAFDLAYLGELKRIIKQRLSKRESRVIMMRFGFGPNGEHTLEEIGQKLKLTRERVRQIEKKALEKLKPILVKVVFEKAIDHGGIFRTWGR